MTALTDFQRAAIIEALGKEDDDAVRERELALVAKYEEGDQVYWHESEPTKETIGEVIEVVVMGFPDVPPGVTKIGYLVDFPGPMGVGHEEFVVAEDLLRFVERNEVPR